MISLFDYLEMNTLSSISELRIKDVTNLFASHHLLFIIIIKLLIITFDYCNHILR